MEMNGKRWKNEEAVLSRENGRQSQNESQEPVLMRTKRSGALEAVDVTKTVCRVTQNSEDLRFVDLYQSLLKRSAACMTALQ